MYRSPLTLIVTVALPAEATRGNGQDNAGQMRDHQPPLNIELFPACRGHYGRG